MYAMLNCKESMVAVADGGRPGSQFIAVLSSADHVHVAQFEADETGVENPFAGHVGLVLYLGEGVAVLLLLRTGLRHARDQPVAVVP